MTAEQKRRLDEAVWVTPQRVSGTPCFRGTRVPVQSLIDSLEGGEAIDQFLQTYPAIAREQVLAVLDFANSQISDAVSPFGNAHEFYDPKSFQELAREQNVKPVADIAALRCVFSESDELDGLLEEDLPGTGVSPQAGVVLLDTDVFSYLLNANDRRADFYRPYVQDKILSVSFVTVGELYYGAVKKLWAWSVWLRWTPRSLPWL